MVDGVFTASVAARFVLQFGYPVSTPLVITTPGDEETARRLGLQGISWVDFLLAGPPKIG